MGDEVGHYRLDIDAVAFESFPEPCLLAPAGILVREAGVAVVDITTELPAVGDRTPEQVPVELGGEVPQAGRLGSVAEPLQY